MGSSDATEMARRGSSKINQKRRKSRFHVTCWGGVEGGRGEGGAR